MPGLTPDHLRELRDALETLRAELDHVLSVGAESSRPVDLDEPIGRLSRMDALQQQSMAAANRRGAQARLRMVEAALGAMARGEYGECRRCEEEIQVARLRARPETPYCLPCQQAIEGRTR